MAERPAVGWITSRILVAVLPEGDIGAGLSRLGTGLLFIWAYLELTAGANYFRKALGAAVLIAIALSYFQ